MCLFLLLLVSILGVSSGQTTQVKVYPQPSTLPGYEVHALSFDVVSGDLPGNVVITPKSTDPLLNPLLNAFYIVAESCVINALPNSFTTDTTTGITTVFASGCTGTSLHFVLLLKQGKYFNPNSGTTLSFDVAIAGKAAVPASYKVGNPGLFADVAPLSTNEANAALSGLALVTASSAPMGSGSTITVAPTWASSVVDTPIVSGPAGCPVTSSTSGSPAILTIHLGQGCNLPAGKPAQFIIAGSTSNPSFLGFSVQVGAETVGALLRVSSTGANVVASATVTPSPHTLGSNVDSLALTMTPVTTFAQPQVLYWNFLYKMFGSTPTVTGPPGCDFTTANDPQSINITLGAGCSFTPDHPAQFSVRGGNLSPNPLYTPVYFIAGAATAREVNVEPTLSYQLAHPDVCPLAQSAYSNALSTGWIAADQRAAVGRAAAITVAATGMPILCTLPQYGDATLWINVINAQQPYTVTSANAPQVTVTYWGQYIPVIAAVATLPPATLQNSSDCTSAFGVFIDRMNVTNFAPLNAGNPVTFQVGLADDVHDVLLADSLAMTGVPLSTSGGTWAQNRVTNNNVVAVTSPKGTVFIGCKDEADSPLGLLGLLGLIAIPCCCCCIPLLLWWCMRRRKAAFFCCPTQPQSQPQCQPQFMMQQDMVMVAGSDPFYPAQPAPYW